MSFSVIKDWRFLRHRRVQLFAVDYKETKTAAINLSALGSKFRVNKVRNNKVPAVSHLLQ